MKEIVLLIWILVPLLVSAKKKPDNAIDFTSIMHYVSSVSSELSSSPKVLADKIVEPYTKDKDRIAALYTWLAYNVKYNVSMSINGYQYQSEDELLDNVMHTHHGVCFHYALYFNELCKQLGYESYYVAGYVRQHDGGISADAHAWNVVRLDSVWYAVDVTWGAGVVMERFYMPRFNPYYCLVSPLQMIKNHMPFDKMWQMLYHPFTYDDFDEQDFEEECPFFNFEDTLRHYQEMSDCEQLASVIYRMNNNGSKNRMVIKELMQFNYNQTVCIHNKNARHLNEGVGYYNKSIELFNQYVAYYNAQFAGISDSVIYNALRVVEQALDSCKVEFAQVHTNQGDMLEALTENRALVESLEKFLYAEIAFVNQYLQVSGKRERMRLMGRRKFE